MTFTPSNMQAKAIRDIKDWYENRTKEQQVFRVFGYAGAGKTTIVSHAIGELGLKTGATGLGADVLYAFTGKAALVMTRKGTPVSTIHSLIYHVSGSTEAKIEKLKKEISELAERIPDIGPRSGSSRKCGSENSNCS